MDEADAFVTKGTLAKISTIGQVRLYRDGAEALSGMQQGLVYPDLVFVDLHMPVMDGVTFLRACLDPTLLNMQLVVLTSSAIDSEALRKRVRSALPVLTKPDGSADLQDALEAVVAAYTTPRGPKPACDRLALEKLLEQLPPSPTRTGFPGAANNDSGGHRGGGVMVRAYSQICGSGCCWRRRLERPPARRRSGSGSGCRRRSSGYGGRG